MQQNKWLLPSMLIFAASLVVFAGIHSVDAVTDTVISRAIQMNRLRVNVLDLTTAPNSEDPDGVCNGLAKRVVLTTVPAGGQINSIVTKARTAFDGPTIEQIGVIAVRAEQNGVQLSSGDIAVPHTDLSDTAYIENRRPATGEIAFYDESDPWDVVAYFCGRDAAAEPRDLLGLTRGVVDFYITVTRN